MADRTAPVSAEGRRHPSTYTVIELHAMCVEDAVKHHATDLAWFVSAMVVIASQRRIPIDDVFNGVLDEVEALTGHRMMPMASGAIL